MWGDGANPSPDRLPRVRSGRIDTAERSFEFNVDRLELLVQEGHLATQAHAIGPCQDRFLDEYRPAVGDVEFVVRSTNERGLGVVVDLRRIGPDDDVVATVEHRGRAQPGELVQNVLALGLAG